MQKCRVFAFFRQPHLGSVQNIYITPFSAPLWICVALAIILLGLIKACFARISGQPFAPLVWIFWTFGALCQRSMQKEFILTVYILWYCMLHTFVFIPDITAFVCSDSLKILIFSSWTFFYTTFTVYSALIISSLLAKQDAIHGYKDLKTFGFTIVSDPQKLHSYIFTDVSWPWELYTVDY